MLPTYQRLRMLKSKRQMVECEHRHSLEGQQGFIVRLDQTLSTDNVPDACVVMQQHGVGDLLGRLALFFCFPQTLKAGMCSLENHPSLDFCIILLSDKLLKAKRKAARQDNTHMKSQG